MVPFLEVPVLADLIGMKLFDSFLEFLSERRVCSENKGCLDGVVEQLPDHGHIRCRTDRCRTHITVRRLVEVFR